MSEKIIIKKSLYLRYKDNESFLKLYSILKSKHLDLAVLKRALAKKKIAQEEVLTLNTGSTSILEESETLGRAVLSIKGQIKQIREHIYTEFEEKTNKKQPTNKLSRVENILRICKEAEDSSFIEKKFLEPKKDESE
jgi:hypothetical protein